MAVGLFPCSAPSETVDGIGETDEIRRERQYSSLSSGVQGLPGLVGASLPPFSITQILEERMLA
jgi:hypothetical protein